MIYVVYYILQYLLGVMWLSPRELAGDDALAEENVRNLAAEPNKGGEGMKHATILGIVSAILLGTCQFTAVAAEKKYGPGLTDTEIKIGQTVPYSGPASAFSSYGRVMAGYFQILQQKGGINGREGKNGKGGGRGRGEISGGAGSLKKKK